MYRPTEHGTLVYGRKVALKLVCNCQKRSGSVRHAKPKGREEVLTPREHGHRRIVLNHSNLDPLERERNLLCWEEYPQQALQVFLYAPGTPFSLSGLRPLERLSPS